MDSKVFAYARVSSKGQAQDDRDGFPRQRAAIEAWAARSGAQVARWFEDAVSGTRQPAERPGFQQLLHALHSNGVRTVVIEKLDRLARDLMVQEAILADFKRHGLTLVSVAEPDLCSEDPGRKLMRQMMGAFSEYERAMIVAKLRGARQRAKAKDPAYREGRKPFGTRPGEPETVKRIAELRSEGKTLKSIVDVLHAEQLPSRTSGEWHPTQVARVLRRSS
jgi:DNA invertase Pin-like site-specific DNA recombinase